MIIPSCFIILTSLYVAWIIYSTTSPGTSMTSREVEDGGGQQLEPGLTRYDEVQHTESILTATNNQHEKQKKKKKYRFPLRQNEKSIISSRLGSENTTPKLASQETFGKSPKTFPENQISGILTLLESTTKKRESHLEGKDNVINPWKLFNEKFPVSEEYDDQLQEIGSSEFKHHSVRKVKRYMMYPNILIEPYDRSDIETTGDYTDLGDNIVNDENCKDFKQVSKYNAKKYPAKVYTNKKTSACEWGGVYRIHCAIYICNYTNLNEEGKGRTTCYTNKDFCDTKPKPCVSTNVFDYDQACEGQCYCVMDKDVTFCEGYPCWSEHFLNEAKNLESDTTTNTIPSTTTTLNPTPKPTSLTQPSTTLHSNESDTTMNTIPSTTTTLNPTPKPTSLTQPLTTLNSNETDTTKFPHTSKAGTVNTTVAMNNGVISGADETTDGVTDKTAVGVADNTTVGVTDNTAVGVSDNTAVGVTNNTAVAVTVGTTRSGLEPNQRGLLTESNEFFTGPDGKVNDSDAVLTDILEKYNLRDVLAQMLLRDYRRIEALEKTMKRKKTEENVTLVPQEGSTTANQGTTTPPPSDTPARTV